MSTEILYEVRDQLTWITLNRPEAMLRADTDDEVRVIVFSGAGECAFCASAGAHEMRRHQCSGAPPGK